MNFEWYEKGNGRNLGDGLRIRVSQKLIYFGANLGKELLESKGFVIFGYDKDSKTFCFKLTENQSNGRRLTAHSSTKTCWLNGSKLPAWLNERGLEFGTYQVLLKGDGTYVIGKKIKD